MGSNQCLWKRAAYGKKKNWLLLCRKPFTASVSFFFFSHRFALHPSLSLYLPSLSTEREFSETPRLNFLAGLGGCLSSPGSPAHKPPPSSNWASDSHTNPLPPHCPFVKPMISAGIFSFRIDWLLGLCLSTATSATHRKWLYPSSQGRISLSALCQMAKANPGHSTQRV